MPANIESDHRWRRFGGLAGVFVFCSISITGALWHSRPARDVRGVDHAAVAAAAYERRWALWRSADPGSLPPRFGESTVTAVLRRAAFDMSGFTRTGLPLEWEGFPESWQAKPFTVGVVAGQDTRAYNISWTLGTNTAGSSWIRVGGADSNLYAEAFSDTGGVFRANGFEVSPPCFDAVLNRWTGGGAWRTFTVRPLPDFPWPADGREAAVTVTNTPGPSEALWPQMHGDFIWAAARSLRSSLLSGGPFWISRAPADGELAVTGAVAWAGGTAAVHAAVADWLRSPSDAEGRSSAALGLQDWSPDPRVPEGGWWRSLSGSTNPAGYSCEGTPLAAVPGTNLLWECLGASTGMHTAAAWVDCGGPRGVMHGFVRGTNAPSLLAASDALGAPTNHYSITGLFSSIAWAFAASSSRRNPHGRESGLASVYAEACASVDVTIPPGFPCASACASGLVSRIRVYAFPFLLDETGLVDPVDSASGPASRSGSVAAFTGPVPGFALPCGLPPAGAPTVSEPPFESACANLVPVDRPAALLAELDPAAFAADTGAVFRVSTGLSASALAAAAAHAVSTLEAAGDGFFIREQGAAFSVQLPRLLLVVAEFNFAHLTSTGTPQHP